MQEYQKAIELKRDAKVQAMSEPEAVNYGTQMALVRDSAKLSGIEQWTAAHTTGALFFGSALRGCFRQLAAMGMLNQAGLSMIENAINEQEIIAVQMELR
jgi:hypothetical protein